MEILLGYVLKGLILPPGGNLFAILVASLLPARLRRLKRGLFAVALVSLWLCCTPWFAAILAAGLETYPALALDAQPDAEAIVVLGGGSDNRAREYGGQDTLRHDTLVRVRYAAMLARTRNLPVAVTGGTVLEGHARPIASIMADVLEQEFHVPVEWIEMNSRNTAQNASGVAAMVPVERIVLVTHASHMRRAVTAFERVGYAVVTAPVAFLHGPDSSAPVISLATLFSWLPSASALEATRAVLHEWIGIGYYAVRYRAVSQ